MGQLSLADLARFGGLPQSQNIDDRRGYDPLSSLKPAPLSLANLAQGYMQERLPTSLSDQAGFSSIFAVDPIMASIREARGPAMRPHQGQLSAAQEFKGELEMLEAENGQQPMWLQYRTSGAKK